ncbi:uncharacterized protein HD556DRAFT_1307517 [Suillus plorans]|uniref:Uncharacterized protein n=1 Tax=Suillus plorans TaxID=116603 RepID=A0A9P7DJC9_9AGAM|nr:uncharacterized protein HD556DRAFT_1307517 [Suillus plorans]KAG1795350.1 hypothetical protein HD556DRAFT_1307517 [Suillus plorans]
MWQASFGSRFGTVRDRSEPKSNRSPNGRTENHTMVRFWLTPGPWTEPQENRTKSPVRTMNSAFIATETLSTLVTRSCWPPGIKTDHEPGYHKLLLLSKRMEYHCGQVGDRHPYLPHLTGMQPSPLRTIWLLLRITWLLLRIIFKLRLHSHKFRADITSSSCLPLCTYARTLYSSSRASASGPSVFFNSDTLDDNSSGHTIMADDTSPSSSTISMSTLPISKHNGKGKRKYSEAEAKRAEAEEQRKEAKEQRKEAEVERKEAAAEREVAAANREAAVANRKQVQVLDENVQHNPASNLKRIFIHIVIRSALKFSLPSGLELRSDNWTVFLARAERRSKIYFASSALVLSSMMLFIATDCITQHPSTTSIASYIVLIVTAFLSFGSLVYSICTIPIIQDVSLIQIKHFVSNDSLHAVLPLLLLSLGIMLNVIANFAFMVTLTIIVWEQNLLCVEGNVRDLVFKRYIKMETESIYTIAWQTMEDIHQQPMRTRQQEMLETWEVKQGSGGESWANRPSEERLTAIDLRMTPLRRLRVNTEERLLVRPVRAPPIQTWTYKHPPEAGACRTRAASDQPIQLL